MDTINERIARLRQKMKEMELDAYLIPSSDPHQSEYVAAHWQSRIWISGFTGSAGTVIITQDHAGLWTDSRYFLQAERELADSEMELHRQKIAHAPPLIPWLTAQFSPGAKVGCDGNLFSIQAMERMENRLQEEGIRLFSKVDLIEEIWLDRPALPLNPIFELATTFAGESRESKLARIRQEMKTEGADYHLVTTLDDIAWILNIRGTDVECNPVAIAYLLIETSTAQLFINPAKVPAELNAKLAAAGVEIKAYQSLEEYLINLPIESCSWIDKGKVNYQLYSSLEHQALIFAPAPSTAMKAIKNETEAKHIKQAMRKDGVALTRLYRWLTATLQERKVPETEVAEKLADLRRAQGDYHGESFSAIVGYRGNGAIVHYRPEPELCADIAPEGILLLDSGGQYTNGTTDITRTTALGTPTEEEKRHFTLVLKGHIGLARVKFPYGTRGNQMEILARQHLWSQGLNYGHGTGHGVGFFLNVHEGPQALGTGATAKANTVFEIGMLTSNEPGYYETGSHGIRIENLVLVVESETTAYGQFLEFETVTLFPIDRQLMDKNLLNTEEINWLNQYHEKVYAELAPLLDSEEQAWLAAQCEQLIG